MNAKHAARVLAHQEDSRWLGHHDWPEPNHAGWTEFEVYRRRNHHNGRIEFCWTAVDKEGMPVGAANGPFTTAKEAHDDAWGGG